MHYLPVRTVGRLAWKIPVAVAVVLFPLAADAADITLDLKIARKPIVLLRGKPTPAHELIREMSRRSVGRTDMSLRTVTRPLYRFDADRDEDGQYRIRAGSLVLAQPAHLAARVAIAYPKLSETQYRALRTQRDYRLVYGYIRGIVEHEEEHAKTFVRFARTTRSLYASPPLGENAGVTIGDGENVSATLARYVSDRIREALDAARRSSDTVQRAIDHTGKLTRVTFRFTEPVGDALPPTLIYQTAGKLRVRFDVPKGNPRPPEPRMQY